MGLKKLGLLAAIAVVSVGVAAAASAGTSSKQYRSRILDLDEPED